MTDAEFETFCIACSCDALPKNGCNCDCHSPDEITYDDADKFYHRTACEATRDFVIDAWNRLTDKFRRFHIVQ